MVSCSVYNDNFYLDEYDQHEYVDHFNLHLDEFVYFNFDEHKYVYDDDALTGVL